MSGKILQKRLLGKLYIKSTIEVKTGLLIGGGEGKLDIGGIDKLVIRDPITEHPYIPGSSLKGKLRSILERFLNKPVNRESNDTWRYESDDLLNGYTQAKGLLIFYEGAGTCQLSRLFGSTGKDTWVKKTDADADGITPPNPEKPKKILELNNYQGREDENGEEYVKVKGRNAPARLIVRDSHLQEKSEQELKKINTGLFMTERKWENGLDRITSAATPRQFERVPKGAKFDLEMVYSIERNEEVNTTLVSDSLTIEYQQAIEDLENLAIALAILEDDALGGSGSRGYGKVKFDNFKLCYHDYQKIRGGGKDFDKELATPPTNTREFLKLFENNAQQFQQLLLESSR
jgi:CRISPR-associated protein Csm3